MTCQAEVNGLKGMGMPSCTQLTAAARAVTWEAYCDDLSTFLSQCVSTVHPVLGQDLLHCSGHHGHVSHSFSDYSGAGLPLIFSGPVPNLFVAIPVP